MGMDIGILERMLYFSPECPTLIIWTNKSSLLTDMHELRKASLYQKI